MFCAIFGHTFRPRFSEKLPKGLTFKGKDPAQVAAQIGAAKLKVYEGDVCVSCGMTANTPIRSFAGTEWSFPEFPAFPDWPDELKKAKEELRKTKEALKAQKP